MVTKVTPSSKGLAQISQVDISDIQLGLKFQFIEGPFEIAYLGHAILSSGSQTREDAGVALSNRILFPIQSVMRSPLGTTLVLIFLERETMLLPTPNSVGFGLTEKLGFYTEVFGDIDQDNRHSFFFDLGFTYLISPNMQADFSIGADVTERYNYYSWGISCRLPKLT